MKKLIFVSILSLILVGCESTINEASGKITSVEKCGEYTTSIIHLDGDRAFKLKDTRCKVLNEGAEVEITYNSSMVIMELKYKTKGDN